MVEDTTTSKTPAPAPKKPKEPALEEKPFGEFIEQNFIPSLQAALKKLGIADLVLTFKQDRLPLLNETGASCWQVTGNWLNDARQFTLYFLEEDINGKKAFSYGENLKTPSTIESFMIDERKATLDLLLFYTLQRLNGQKWLARN